MNAENTYRKLLFALPIKEQHFVGEYLIHGNATKAARKLKMGNAETGSDRMMAWRLLQTDHIKEVVVAGMAALAERCEIDADKLVRELAAVAFSNVSNYAIDEEGYVELEEDAPGEAIRAVASIRRKKRVRVDDEGVAETTYETEFRMWDKLGALTLLGRKLKMFTDKLEFENPQDSLYRELLKSLKDERGATDTAGELG
jgi:phage terminase small subunit